MSVIKGLIELEPENVGYKFVLAKVYWDADQKNEADVLLKEIIASDPGNEDNRMGVARFYISKKQFEVAEHDLKAGIQLNEKSFNLRILLGEIYLSLRKTDKAVEILKECISISPDPANPGIIQAKNALAKLYLMTGDIEESEKYVDEVLKESPRSVEGHFSKGQIYLLKAWRTLFEYDIITNPETLLCIFA